MVNTILNERCKCSIFETKSGASEYFFVFEAKEQSYSQTLDVMFKDVQDALAQFGLPFDSTVFTRYHLSDATNQQNQLLDSDLYKNLSSGAQSMVQQSPLGAGKFTLLSYHIKSKKLKGSDVGTTTDKNWQNNKLFSGQHYSLLWSSNIQGSEVFDAYKQTHEIFNSYLKLLKEQDLSLFHNTLRTWFYVRDIDNHYDGLVEGRNDVFNAHGLTRDTHYITSTGIEGRLANTSTLVSMDALSIEGIKKEQITQLEALEHLSPTHAYGVKFERGTKLTFGDREHFHISGTASIDKCGQVVHEEDVEKQTQRTLENIKALLTPHGASLENMAYLTVYLRNFTHEKQVRKILRKELGEEIPIVLVRGAVCRPTWLVEIEGIGIRSAETDFPPFL
ncbi:MAG: hypothetical protein HQL32_11120 [Planctomycetes bacterium]|nr:hypothetical protein [Planctomycetota bacterium]